MSRLALTVLLLAGLSHASGLPDAPSRHKQLAAIVAASAFDVAASAYDIHETERGLRMGVAVERNTWLVGAHPSTGALWGKNLLQFGLCVSPSTLVYAFHKPAALVYGLLAAPLVDGAKHIQGGREWVTLEGR
jgi:hypothetical protein